MSEQNTLKKTLKIEAAFVDFTRLTDEKLACYEKVEIDAASVILSESAQAVLQKYSHNINAASIITVPDGCTVDTKNGSYTLAPNDKASGLKALIINGSCTVLPNSEDALASYQTVVVNGSILLPAGANISNLEVNGSQTVYPADAVLIQDDLDADRLFALRAKKDALYYVTGVVRMLKNDGAAQILAEKNVRFVCERALVCEESLEQAAPLFDESVRFTVTPAGMIYVPGGAALNTALLARYGTRLFVDGNLSIDNDDGSLAKVEALQVQGHVRLIQALEEAFYAKCHDFGGMRIIGVGKLLADRPQITVTTALLDECTQGIWLADCAMVTIADDVPLDLLRQRLLGITDCSMINCLDAHRGIVEAASDGISMVNSHPAGAPQEQKPQNTDDTVTVIKSATYQI